MPDTADHRVIAWALGLSLGIGIGLGALALATAGPAAADTSGGAGAADHRSARADGRPARPTVATRARSAARADGSASGVSVTRSGQSPFPLSSRGTGAAELSGITYGGGTTYYAVGDNGAPAIWQLYTSLSLATGRIRSSLVSGAIDAPELGSDSEGIALGPQGDTVWVADEVASTISEFSLTTGSKVGAVSVPEIYRPANVQANMGLESLTYGQGSLWTANEEALKPDGPLSTTEAGSWVRIQQFSGPGLTPSAQYAYRTDPISRLSPFVSVERSGLVDLLVLPNGAILALERELGGCLPRFRSRVYLLDLTGASDVADIPSLVDATFTPAAKTLLWQGFFGFSNFEAITLGPQLSDGSYSLLLVSDNGNGELAQRQDTFTLVLGGAGVTTAPPPSPEQVAALV